jgi:acyl-CoA thioesterase I
MSPFLLIFTDGTIFFIGLAMVFFANLLLFHFRRSYLRWILTPSALIGLIFVIVSATPLPLWTYALWMMPAMGCLIFGNLVRLPRTPWILAGVLVLFVTIGLIIVEMPYRRLPRITVPSGKIIYVVGDSLSAGTGGGERCWPVVLNETSHLPVINLAVPGATVQTAIQQAEKIGQPNSVVIVEIGGNDLLDGIEACVFRDGLDRLLSTIRSNHHEVIMLELPLFPFKNSFGKAQRDMAAKHGVALLPKRCLAKVLGMKNGTLDGIHLSQTGHNALADILAQVLKAGDGKGE